MAALHQCSRAPPPMAPGPRPPAVPHERTHANQREGGRWRTIPDSASSQSGEPHQSRDGHPFTRRKEQHHTLSGNEHVTVTLLLTSDSNHRQQPYHTSVERTAPHRRGGAIQKDHRPHSTGGGGDEAKQEHPGRRESNKAKQDDYTLDRQARGIPWGGGCSSPASYIHENRVRPKNNDSNIEIIVRKVRTATTAIAIAVSNKNK